MRTIMLLILVLSLVCAIGGVYAAMTGDLLLSVVLYALTTTGVLVERTIDYLVTA